MVDMTTRFCLVALLNADATAIDVLVGLDRRHVLGPCDTGRPIRLDWWDWIGSMHSDHATPVARFGLGWWDWIGSMYSDHATPVARFGLDWRQPVFGSCGANRNDGVVWRRMIVLGLCVAAGDDGFVFGSKSFDCGED
jgi:hypothetical protein